MTIGFPAIFVVVLAVASLVYAAVLSGFARGLRRLRRNVVIEPAEWPSVSVILPARNEAAVLERTLASLFQQDYPGDWEIVVVDDRSSDDTPRILEEIARSNGRLLAFRVTDPHPKSPKKNALALGIRESHGSIIVTTDADCTYSSGWLRSMISHMDPKVGVVAGLTMFELPTPRVPFWQKTQWLDFIVQQFMAAGAVGYGVPSSCNGSNLAYRRQVYDEIAGFGTASNQVSGDDVLFAQRVAKLTKWKTVFATTTDSVVRSLSVLTVRELIHQRLRWASKGLAYRRSMSVFLFGLYAFYFSWLAAPIIAILYPATIPGLALTALWKLAWEFGMVRLGCRLFRQTQLLPYFLPYVILHVTTSPLFGIGGLIFAYRWKGEWYRTARLPRPLRYRLVRARRASRRRRAMETTV
ncbi:glycosyltransferase [bacterium]|nr:glycosyltransferase [bacterium]MBU1983749.1 glycosyltransferase [bacterium]